MSKVKKERKIMLDMSEIADKTIFGNIAKLIYIINKRFWNSGSKHNNISRLIWRIKGSSLENTTIATGYFNEKFKDNANWKCFLLADKLLNTNCFKKG